MEKVRTKGARKPHSERVRDLRTHLYLLAHFVATRVGHLVDADQLSSEFLAFAAETLGRVHWSLVEERELETNLIRRRKIKN